MRPVPGIPISSVGNRDTHGNTLKPVFKKDNIGGSLQHDVYRKVNKVKENQSGVNMIHQVREERCGLAHLAL